MFRSNVPVRARGTHTRLPAVALAGASLLMAWSGAEAQSFYQLTNPRVYRVNPPTNNPWYHGYGFGGLATEPVSGDPNGRILLAWEADPPNRGDLLEFTLNFDSLPDPSGTNDAVPLGQTPDWGWCYAMDYESDDRVLVFSRTDYFPPQSPGDGVGRLIRENGQIVGMEITNPFTAEAALPGSGDKGAFAGYRGIAGGVYDVVITVFKKTAGSGMYLIDVNTGRFINLDPDGTNSDTPLGLYVPLTGDIVVDSAAPSMGDKWRFGGIDIVNDTAFVLMVLYEQTAQQYMAVVQVDLATKRILAVANASQMLNPNRAGQFNGYTWGFDVSPLSDTQVRVLIADGTDRSQTSLVAIDGISVAEGSPAVDPDAIYVAPSDGGGTPNQPSQDNNQTNTQGEPIMWVCPGFGIILPTIVTFVGLGLSARVRRQMPPV